MGSLKDNEFKEKKYLLKKNIQEGRGLDSIIPESFALVREAAKRTLNERHYDVQLAGGIILHKGKIAEMKTGEGKTLVSTLPAYLNSLTNKGVHIVTVNDYLAKRDCENMGKIYNFLGVRSGFINNDQDDYERQKNYNCDITYATNSELGFDYLRDNMKVSIDSMVQRKHNFAIVDEIDSCLIDEARTPLVISGAAEDKTDKYVVVNKLIKRLENNDFELDEKEKNVFLTNKGIDNIENIFSNAGVLKNNNFYDPSNLNIVHHVNQQVWRFQPLNLVAMLIKWLLHSLGKHRLEVHSGDGAGSQGKEVICLDLAVDDPAAARLEKMRETGEGDLGRIGGAAEHALAEEGAADAHAVQAAGQAPLPVPGLDAVGVAGVVERPVGGHHARRDPGPVLAGARGGTGLHHLAEAGVHGEPEALPAQRAAQAAGAVEFGGKQHQPWIRCPPEHGLGLLEPGENAAPIGGQEPVGAEVLADGEEAARVVEGLAGGREGIVRRQERQQRHGN